MKIEGVFLISKCDGDDRVDFVLDFEVGDGGVVILQIKKERGCSLCNTSHYYYYPIKLTKYSFLDQRIFSQYFLV